MSPLKLFTTTVIRIDRKTPFFGIRMLSEESILFVERRQLERFLICDFDKLRSCFVQTFVRSFQRAPERMILNVDPTNIDSHGNQE